jgi:hypothetical protein
MADPTEMNGPVLAALPPQRPIIPEIPRLGPRSGWPELAAGYATVASAFALHVPAVYEELNEMRAAINLLGTRMALGPMRRSADSSHAMHEFAQNAALSAQVDAQKIVDDPDRNLTPETVAGLVEAKVATALAAKHEADEVKKLKADAQRRDEAEAAAIVEEKVRAKERRDFRRNLIIAVVGGAFAFAGVVYGVYMQGRTQGHGEGFAERAALPPAVLPVVPLPSTAFAAIATASSSSASASSASHAPPPAAPAAVAAPRHP